jgi:RsiW-degrading membrane proteinase PrsW (M82 family)
MLVVSANIVVWSSMMFCIAAGLGFEMLNTFGTLVWGPVRLKAASIHGKCGTSVILNLEAERSN